VKDEKQNMNDIPISGIIRWGSTENSEKITSSIARRKTNDTEEMPISGVIRWSSTENSEITMSLVVKWKTKESKDTPISDVKKGKV